MFGKMSVGVRTAAVTPKMTISIAITTNVYGLLSAMRTMASIDLYDGLLFDAPLPSPIRGRAMHASSACTIWFPSLSGTTNH